MMCAGWIRFRASLMAMRRTSWIDHRINDGVALIWLLPWLGVWFFLAAADWRDGGSPPSWRRRASPWKRGDASHAEDLLSLWSSPNSFLAVWEGSSIAHRWPSTSTSVSIDVAAGHQVVKKARSPSAIRRRISRPRVQGPGFSSIDSPTRSGQSAARQKKPNAEPRQKPNPRATPSLIPMVNPGSPPHCHQARGRKRDPTRTHHRMVTLA